MEAQPLYCLACGKLGVTTTVYGAQLCTECSNLAQANEKVVKEEVKVAVVEVVKRFSKRPPIVEKKGAP